jgi:hypothetical protein
VHQAKGLPCGDPLSLASGDPDSFGVDRASHDPAATYARREADSVAAVTPDRRFEQTTHSRDSKLGSERDGAVVCGSTTGC